MRVINKIIIHCAATKPSMDIGVDEIRGWHVNERGWSDIGYHYVIRKDGTIEKGRDVNRAGAHARGHNASSIGICLVGGLSDDNKAVNDFNHDQMSTLRKLVGELSHKHKINDIIGHNEVSSKTCPNFDVKKWWNDETNINGEL